MAFPTSGLVNNLVHKEGNRTFVYDSATSFWDRVREIDRAETRILQGEIGSAVTFPVGHVIQTITSSNTTTSYFGSGTNYDLMTDFAVTILPKFSNSKIIITFNCGIMINGSVTHVKMKVTGTTTGEVMRQNQWGYITAGSWNSFPLAVNAIDTPGTTVAQTYQLYLGTGTSVSDSNARLNSEGNTASGNVIAMEIKV
jgi:hypothetical protein